MLAEIQKLNPSLAEYFKAWCSMVLEAKRVRNCHNCQFWDGQDCELTGKEVLEEDRTEPCLNWREKT